MKAAAVNDLPVTVQPDTATGEYHPCQEKDARRVSHLGIMFSDQEAVKELVAASDPLVYEIRYYKFITSKSDMALGTTMILPGKVGAEYHLTKGHFHARDDQPEIYYCVHGEGFLQMESRDGDYQVTAWKAGTVTLTE